MLRGNQLIGFGGRPADATAYRYLRIHITTSNGDIQLHEIEWLVDATPYPTSNMSSNTAPSPLVASASSEYSGSYQAWENFDGDSSGGGWSPSPLAGNDEYAQIDLGAGNEIVPTGVQISPYSNSYAPQAFEALASNNGSDWDELGAWTGLSSGWTGDVFREFTF